METKCTTAASSSEIKSRFLFDSKTAELCIRLQNRGVKLEQAQEESTVVRTNELDVIWCVKSCMLPKFLYCGSYI